MIHANKYALGSGNGDFGDYEEKFGITFGIYTLTLHGISASKYYMESLINKEYYKGCIVVNKEDFDSVQAMAKKYETKQFPTYFIKWRFSEDIQKKYQSKAKEKGYTGDIYHPMIMISDGNQNLYFDWLMKGFWIRNYPHFDIYETRNKINNIIKIV